MKRNLFDFADNQAAEVIDICQCYISVEAELESNTGYVIIFKSKCIISCFIENN